MKFLIGFCSAETGVTEESRRTDARAKFIPYIWPNYNVHLDFPEIMGFLSKTLPFGGNRSCEVAIFFPNI